MPRATRLDALLALLDAPGVGVDGTTLTRALTDAGLRTSPTRLLRSLLELEDSGHVSIRRPDYEFAITDLGREAVIDLAPGAAIHATVVLMDLVGFVAFTDDRGDQAAARAARLLRDVAADELERRGGRLVKHLGDGILGAVAPEVDAVELVAAIADRLRHDDGTPWPVRAAARTGRPIAMAGDLFGADVNLVARLCALAAPGELVIGAADDACDGAPLLEHVEVRGLSEPVAVIRVPL